MAVIPARTLTLSLITASLGTVMMVMGLLVIFDWPSKFGLSARIGFLLGVPLCAMGQFLYAAAADFLFPDADARLTGLFELAPWIIVAFTLLGGLIWILA
jgi:hypothetical protein